MRLFIDTNIILDVLLRRDPFVDASLQVLAACDVGSHEGAITTLTVCNLMYVLRKYLPLQESREEVLAMTEWLRLIALEPADVTMALSERNSDFEDAVQISCASQWGAEVIVTRNPKDFAHASIPVLTPESFLDRYITSEDER